MHSNIDSMENPFQLSTFTWISKLVISSIQRRLTGESEISFYSTSNRRYRWFHSTDEWRQRRRTTMDCYWRIVSWLFIFSPSTFFYISSCSKSCCMVSSQTSWTNLWSTCLFSSHSCYDGLLWYNLHHSHWECIGSGYLKIVEDDFKKIGGQCFDLVNAIWDNGGINWAKFQLTNGLNDAQKLLQSAEGRDKLSKTFK